MQRTLKRWLVSFPYDSTVQYGSLLGILGLVRRVVSVCTFLIVVSSFLALGSDAGPSEQWRLTVVLVLVAGLVASAVWWQATWPRERTSLAFVAGADLAIVFMLLTYTDPLLALPGTCVLAVIGIYVSMLHGPRAMAAHVLLSVTLASVLAFAAYDRGADLAMTASTLVGLIAVVVGIPAAVQVAWSTIRHEGMRSLLDPLTGLLNRRGLHTSVLGALPELDPRRPDQRVVVVSADLDAFKRLNDAHGHEAGDVALRLVTTRLTEDWSHGGRWARIGGEELILVTTADGAVVQDLGRDAVGLIHHAGDPHPVTASVGVAVTDRVPRGRCLADRRAWLDDLVARADEAMYDAKGAGGNRSVAYLDPIGSASPPPTT